MTRTELNDLSEYIRSLWPKFNLSKEQADIWFNRLSYSNVFDVRKAVAEAYANDAWNEAKLSKILEAIRVIKRGKAGPVGNDLPPEFIAQVQREEAEELALLADWTPQELADGKAEILRREPHLKPMDTKGIGSMWRHFIVERYVHQRAIIFPDGDPVEINRDEYWDAIARNQRGKGPLADVLKGALDEARK